MNRYARTAPGKTLEIISTSPPFSFFNFVESRFSTYQPLRRILSQVRMHAGRTMVIERLGQPQDLREENEDLRKRNPDFASSTAFRLSFFTKEFSTKRGLLSVADRDFVGYAILKEDIAASFGTVRRVYESVIKSRRRENISIRGEQMWPCSAGGKQFLVPGYLYAQQNNLTKVCAHVALRTAAARFHKNGDMLYREMNNLLGIDHVNVKTGEGTGLTTRQMVQVLEAAGARCFQANYSGSTANPPPFQKYVYGSIESGFPAILIFGTTDPSGGLHAVPVFGHTFDEDTWVPSADLSYFKIGRGTIYIPSESWLSTFIAHDDNWGSNYRIPRHYLRVQQQFPPGQIPSQPSQSVSECVAHVISTVPNKVKLNPIRAEVIGADYLFTILPQLPPDNNQWAKRLSFYASQHLLVLRPSLLTRDEYVAHLAKLRDWQGNPITKQWLAILKRLLPDEWIWMIELSVPELFSANRRKVGEVLVRAEALPKIQRDLASFILARMPGYFRLYAGGGSANPRYHFIPAGVDGHVELVG